MARRLTVAVLLAAVAAGCATMNVSSHVERGLDFAKYRSFAWGSPDTLPTGDPRLDKNPYFQDHMIGAVEKGLAARGFQLVAPGTADLLVHYHANVSERIDIDRLDRQRGYQSVIEWEAGTLVIDIVDARTNTVIWRGWAQQRLDNILQDQDGMAKAIQAAVAGMLQRLPPAL
jgi:hypothetical protein